MPPRRRPASRLLTVARYTATFLAGLIIGLSMGGCALVWKPTVATGRTPEAVFSELDRSFVTVLTKGPTGHTVQGSGAVVYNLAGHHLVLTAAHLFHSDEAEVIVMAARHHLGAPDDGEGLSGKLLLKDDVTDLALLEVYGKLPRDILPVATTMPSRYSPVYTEGSPNDAPSTVSSGVLNSIRRNSHKQIAWQISAVCWPGSSGGPVVNAAGQLIGVLVGVHMVEDYTVEEQKHVLIPNICYAVPLEAIQTFLKRAGVQL